MKIRSMFATTALSISMLAAAPASAAQSQDHSGKQMGQQSMTGNMQMDQQQMKEMQQHMLKLHDQMHKIREAKSESDRKQLEQQHLKMMQDHMQKMMVMKQKMNNDMQRQGQSSSKHPQPER